MTGAVLDRDDRRDWLRAWATIGGSFAANQAIKLAVRRPRPDVPGLPPLIGTMSNRSYPSAHATTSAVALRTLPPLIRDSAARLRPSSAVASAAGAAIAAFALAMPLSRLYLGVHWPSDVAAGFALGAAIGELAA